MRRLSRTLFVLLLLLTAGRASAEPVASLVTVGPGDAIWEKFGHNMIRIQDDERGFDACYNWGVFDFEKPNFFLNFARGRMLYTMQAWPTEAALDEYRQQNRRVTLQRLRLSPEQLRALIVRCETNRRPENADYRYDYFQDNCSTRVRDTLDAATGGAIAHVAKNKPTVPTATFRSDMVRLTAGPVWTPDFWLSVGMDFLLGPAGDKPLDVWADGFLPAVVAESVTAFADPPVEPWTSTRPPPPAFPPTRWPWLMAVGAAYAALVMGVQKHDLKTRVHAESRSAVRRLLLVSPVVLWWLVSGFGGVLMLSMWLFTDHTAVYANQNLWAFSPLAWLALGAAMIRQRRAAANAAMLIAVMSVIGGVWWIIGRFGGPVVQHNGGFLLLALPINGAVAWSVSCSLTKPAVADGMIS